MDANKLMNGNKSCRHIKAGQNEKETNHHDS